MNSESPKSACALRKRAFTLSRSFSSTLSQAFLASWYCFNFRWQAALFSSHTFFSSCAFALVSSLKLSVWLRRSATFLYLSRANSVLPCLNKADPTSLRAMPNSTFSSAEISQVSFPFSKSTSSRLRTIFWQDGAELSPNCGSTHLSGCMQVRMARSPFFISKTAHSNASHTSPLPTLNSSVLAVKPDTGCSPSVAASTESFTLLVSFGVSWPSPCLICFFMIDLSLQNDTSLTS
mmetsp:Transcript_12755/g.20171  ORF Transcript_12755/g.20171 Transcript_12755/m.20171 type:complete len:235 (-) Transcript_12755:185-889(-)